MPDLVCIPGLLCTPDVFDATLHGVMQTDDNAAANHAHARAAVWPAPVLARFDAIIDAHAKALDRDRPRVVIGHSMGAYLALALALRAPERIAGLVLISANAAADSEKAAAMRAKVCTWARKAGMDALAGSIADTMLAPDHRTDETLRARLRKMSAAYGLEPFCAHQSALAERPDQTARLSELRCKVLVLTGSEDTVTPPDAGRAIAAGVRDGSFELLDGVGHLPPLECPERLAPRIRAFLDTVAQDRAA